MTDETNDHRKLTPCDVCKFGKWSAECMGCPHSWPQTWGDIGCGCLALIGLFLLGALCARFFA